MTNIYLSASYTRREEMQGVRDVLEAMGHRVTSRWIDQQLEALGTGNAAMTSNNSRLCAKRDMEDMLEATCFMMFTGDQGSRGGRHTEFGFFMAALSSIPTMEMVIVGPLENPFQGLDFVIQFNDWYSCAVEMWKFVHDSERHRRDVNALLHMGQKPEDLEGKIVQIWIPDQREGRHE